MMQLKYKHARASLKGKMIKLKHRLAEANTDLGKFKDIGISIHDHNALVVKLETHQDMLQRKTALCNNKLMQLHSTIENAASKEQSWAIKFLQTEYKQLEAEYDKYYTGFQEFRREFVVQKAFSMEVRALSNICR